MTRYFDRSYSIPGAILSLLLLTTPTTVLAHAGHGDEFHQEAATSQPTTAIQVDAETASRMGIKVEPVTRQQLAIGVKTTGQIETLPNKQVEVTAPIPGKIVELLVEPGAAVKAGQPVAVIAAPDLVELRVHSQEKRAEADANLQQALADLTLAQQNYERYQKIAADEIAQAKSLLAFAQEKYQKDRELSNVGAIPRRQALESQTELAKAKAELTKANSLREVIEAEAQVKRAESAVEVAKSRIRLSSVTYETRLQQLGTRANDKGLVTVSAPIAGKVADREVTLGQAFEDAGGKLMTIVNDSQVFATANIYEKDLDKVKIGQRVNLKVASLPNQIFSGRITVIGSVVQGETRVVPVKAEIENSARGLKPGMFAELEVLTNQTAAPILVIPSSAVVEANGSQQVYVQNGKAYQPVEVSLGETSGDLVEVKSGLFEGDLVVTQRATQIYAQSLRGGSKAAADKHDEPEKEAGKTQESKLPMSLIKSVEQVPLWWIIPAGGAIATGIFFAGIALGKRYAKTRFAPVGALESDTPMSEIKAQINHNPKHSTWPELNYHVEEHKDAHSRQS